MYYIRDRRSFVGNACLWWREGGKGYTTNLDDAGKFTEEDAHRIHRNRSTDEPIPCAVVERAATRVVNYGDLCRDKAERQTPEVGK